MNTSFNILWFEDESAWYKMQLPQVETAVATHCLQCQSTWKQNDKLDMNSFVGRTFDLILMDYDLASKTTGEQIIKTIRDANILTDILFYSSQYDTMIQAATSIFPPLDGIYYSSRKIEEFQLKLSQVINKIVQRSENLINLRGFVLDSTSDFELRIREMLTICWKKFNDDQKKLLFDVILQVLDQKCQRINAQVSKAKGQVCPYTYVNNDDHLLSVADRLDILQCILHILIDEYGMPVSKDYKDFKEYYIKKVNMYRNRLGHVKLGENVLTLEGKAIPIDQNLHRLLRKNVCDVDKNILAIEQYITSI